MSAVERGILGEKLSERNWFVYALDPERDPERRGRIIAATSLCQEDFPSRAEFFQKLIQVKKEFAKKYGWENMGTGSGGGFLDFVSEWSDELALGAQDQPIKKI